MNHEQKQKLFTEIAQASNTLFSVEDIAYFFEKVAPKLDYDDSFMDYYRAACELSDSDLEIVFRDTDGIVKAINRITWDTKIYDLDIPDHCAHIASLVKDEDLKDLITCNAKKETKHYFIERETNDFQFLRYGYMSQDLKWREHYTAENFLKEFDGDIAKAILQRNLSIKLPPKGKKSKTQKI